MKKRILPLVMALVMCLGLFAGCQSSELRAYSDESPSPGVEGSETLVKDYTPAFESFAPDTVMLTINDYDITWQELFYWYFSHVESIEASYGEITDWDELMLYEDRTYREVITEESLEAIKYYTSIESKFADLGLELTEDELAELDGQIASIIESLGSEEAYYQRLAEMYLTSELYYKYVTANYQILALQNEIIGSGGEKLDEAELLAKAEEKGMMRAKHILVSTVDDTYTPLEDAVIAEKLATAETILAELQAITDPEELETRVDELCLEYGEDPGTAYYTDGYTFGAGEMDAAFETAVAEMEDYGLSGIVETMYGYHIILRLPLEASAVVEYDDYGMPYTLAYLMSQEIFSTVLDGWLEECEIVYSSEYESIDLPVLFAKAVMVPAPVTAEE